MREEMIPGKTFTVMTDNADAAMEYAASLVKYRVSFSHQEVDYLHAFTSDNEEIVHLMDMVEREAYSQGETRMRLWRRDSE